MSHAASNAAISLVSTYADIDAETTKTCATAINWACKRIAPCWPLDQSIAFNPYWGWLDHSFADTASTIASLDHLRLQMPMDYYATRWQRGEIREGHLQQALREFHAQTPSSAAAPLTLQMVIQALHHSPTPTLCLLSEYRDAMRARAHAPAWQAIITHQIGQHCAAHFDQWQASWNPARAATSESLYTSWRTTLSHDPEISLLTGDRAIRQRATQLPATAHDCIQQALQALNIPTQHWPAFLLAVLLRIKGWAGWCAWLQWPPTLKANSSLPKLEAWLEQLLAIRLAWEWLLDDGQRDTQSLWAAWSAQLNHVLDGLFDRLTAREPSPSISAALIWQRALELSYSDALRDKLMASLQQRNAVSQEIVTTAPRVQAFFCIDVRSEPMRRALEATSTEVSTHGFAGFFGLPMQFTALGSQHGSVHLPGLLAPSVQAVESTGDAARDRQLAQHQQVKWTTQAAQLELTTLPASAPSMVEVTGLFTIGKLCRALWQRVAPNSPSPSALTAAHTQPQLSMSTSDQAALAARIVQAMELAHRCAPLVVIVGHGSQSHNNPQASGLECGACGGQSGEVSVRTLVHLLNNPEVRQRMIEHGVQLPQQTWFVAALHNTTTDEVTLLDTAHVPAAWSDDIAQLSGWLESAGHQVRSERALAYYPTSSASPLSTLMLARRRAHDWAETRPEWGLANNAAFIIAPRELTREINLQGRVFLHDYAEALDADGSALETIMGGPMVVTHWINLQYYASTVDPQNYGSGNKLLHNVVGGNIGVFEGNGGDLRMGLAIQSVHDGEDWRHEPLRLSVFIAATRERIEQVMQRNATIKQLVEHQWLHLYRIDTHISLIEHYRGRQWRIEESAPLASMEKK